VPLPTRTQYEVEPLSKQAAKREPKRRSVGVERVVLTAPPPEVLEAGAHAAYWRRLRGDAGIQQGRPAQEMHLVLSIAAGSCLKYQAEEGSR
jgi:hypothetical protein